MMRHGKPGQGQHLGNLPDIKPLARLEQQQDALPMLVAQRHKDFRHRLPGRGDGSGVVGFHVDYLRHIDMTKSSFATVF